MDQRSPIGHTICVIKEGESYFTLDNSKYGLSGPYNSINEIRYNFGFKNKAYVIESLADLKLRFQ